MRKDLGPEPLLEVKVPNQDNFNIKVMDNDNQDLRNF